MKEYMSPEIEFTAFAVENTITIDLSFGDDTSREAEVEAW